MKRRDLLSMGVGVALSVPTFKTVAWLRQRDRIQRAMDAVLDTITMAPAMAAELKPSDDASNVWPTSQAYLRMMAQAEGTYIPGRADYNPYRVLVGSMPDSPKLIPLDGKEWSKHPGFRSWEGNSKSKYKPLYTPGDMNVPGYPLRFPGDLSDAAGACQFISTTWQGMRHDLGFAYEESAGDFAPVNQDLATLYLTGRTGGHWWLRSAISKKGDHIWIDYGKWLNAVRADSSQWASFKGANIGASTGQGTKPDWWMWSRFVDHLWAATGRHRHVLFPAAGYGLEHRTDKMGWRTWTRPPRMHWGTDFGLPAGTPLLATEAGTVTGKEALGFSFVPDRDISLKLRFFHCRVEDSVLDKWVPQGAVIGKVGPKDHLSTGPHLHLEVSAYGQLIDPWFYIGMSEWFLPE